MARHTRVRSVRRQSLMYLRRTRRSPLTTYRTSAALLPAVMSSVTKKSSISALMTCTDYTGLSDFLLVVHHSQHVIYVPTALDTTPESQCLHQWDVIFYHYSEIFDAYRTFWLYSVLSPLMHFKVSSRINLLTSIYKTIIGFTDCYCSCHLMLCQNPQLPTTVVLCWWAWPVVT